MSGWLEFFIAIATIAIVIQMAILLAIYLQMRAAVAHFMRIAAQLQSRVDPILVRTHRILDDSEDRIRTIMSNAAELTEIARNQAQKVDRVFTDAVERLRIQVVKADQILTGALELIEEAGATFRSKLWQPFHQASAILKGVKAGIDFIRGQARRPEADPTTQDEELFI
jgi:MFS superfamily sulfate permease-like transporter